MNWREFGGRAPVSIWLPTSMAVVLAVIYLVELQLAGSYRYGAAYSYITNLPGRYDLLLGIFEPFLHSNHGHAIWNLGFFLVLSFVVLSQAPVREYLTIFFGAAWFTASLIPWILSGGEGLAFGISGANAALAGWGTLLGMQSIQRTADESFVSVQQAKSLRLFVVPTLVVATDLAQAIGVLSTGEGVSVGGHLLGIAFGLASGALLVFVDWS